MNAENRPNTPVVTASILQYPVGLPGRVSRDGVAELARPGADPRMSLFMLPKRVVASVIIAALLLGFTGLVLSVLR